MSVMGGVFAKDSLLAGFRVIVGLRKLHILFYCNKDLRNVFLFFKSSILSKKCFFIFMAVNG
jgi:hypothetical protein